MRIFKTAVLVVAGFAASVSSLAPPQFASEYQATGSILLPYADLNEPFTAYYSETYNKSRIDYYGDLMLTVQRPDKGAFYKIAYMTDDKGEAKRVCFNEEASPVAPVTIQSIFPDLSQFEIVYAGPCHGAKDGRVMAYGKDKCEAWQYVNLVGQKKNLYQFYLRRDAQGYAVPIVYIMMGYDSLLGSHYDKYEVIYETYTPGPVDQKVFNVADSFKCRGFPGPGHQTMSSMNPLHEFVHGKTEHMDIDFDHFKNKHSKAYADEIEHARRHMIFRQHYRLINSNNRRLTQYKLAINHLADRTDDELRILRGRAKNTGYNGGMEFNKQEYKMEDVPENWDWRLSGAVNPVKDQAVCGSCWSFGTTGTIEGVYFVKTGNLVNLAEQQLMDCSWSEGNNACDGGEDFRAYDYLMKAGGIALNENYGPYLGVDGKCHDKNVKKSVKITGFYNVTTGDAESLKTALYFHGPVTVAIDASPKTFTFYSHGVYYDPVCSSTELDHQVLAVGYGILRGEKYWLIKNSWSTYWGNDGYVLISQKNNDCGVTTDATYPQVE